MLDGEVIERDGPQERLLVLLHGYGEPVADLTDRLDRIDPDARFLAVAPPAPFEHKGKAIWHRALTAPEESGRQFLASMAAIDDHLGALGERTGLDPADAVVGGFSQGGGLALALLLAGGLRHRPAAAFGICSFPPHVVGFPFDPAAPVGRPFLLWSARDDRFAPIESSRAGAATLIECGLALTYRETDDGHVMTDEAAEAIGAWLAELDADTPPARSPLLDGVAPLERVRAMWAPVA